MSVTDGLEHNIRSRFLEMFSLQGPANITVVELHPWEIFPTKHSCSFKSRRITCSW